MDQAERTARIRAYLGIKPIIHGQVQTFQIAIPESEIIEIPTEKRAALINSLTAQGSNLIPLIVRKTEAYSEEEEYELVYGADWCLVAKELEIEKLWVWVFDLTDEQAAAMKVEMQEIVSLPLEPGILPPLPDGIKEVKVLLQQFGRSVQDKLDAVNGKVNQLANLEKIVAENENRLNAIDHSINSLSSKFEEILIIIHERFSHKDPKLKLDLYPAEETFPKLNLLTATETEISDALEIAKVQPQQIKAALKAINSWKSPGKQLTWRNLEKSTKKGDKKIDDFGEATYKKLQYIGDILT